MSNLRCACRPHFLFASITCRRSAVRIPIPSHQFGPRAINARPEYICNKTERTWARLHQQRRMVITGAYNWNSSKSPYETLELERDADEEQVKLAYRRLAKFYHPDVTYAPLLLIFLVLLLQVYDGRGQLEEGETAETRFIIIQAAYELLVNEEQRREYDREHRVNPMKASQAWMDWLMKKRKAFDQRGTMAIAAWAEQQQRELNVRARRLSRSKVDPDEERKILAREKKASAEQFNSTLRRHTLVLKKRDLMRKKAEEEKKKVISRLLAAEGLELDEDDKTS
ncbi:chaperone [Lithospermum erythrorhizon]|uniref:Chaperone n=1 Tax=Lithospermum erythrorhizon TaxID=34254 RepID=A0AAV3RLY6_LITER